MTAGSIAAARVACENGDLARALGELRDVWRRTPHAELADAIERVGKRAGAGRALPLADDWEALAARRDPCDLEVLLATLGEGAVGPRFATLAATHGPDPRLARALVDALLGCKHVWRFADYKPLFVGLARCGDPRALAQLSQIGGCWGELADRKDRRMRGPIERGVAKYLPEAERALGALAVPALADDDRAALAAIVAALVPDRDPAIEAALLAAVYADPASDGPRAIYADYLIERGDPRGELIALQLTGIDDARTRNLTNLHERAWLGALAPAVDFAWFRRGFPYFAAMHPRDAYAPEPAWATLEEVSRAVPASDANAMPVLARAVDLAAVDLVRLAAMTRPPPIATLEVSVLDDELAGARAALRRLRLPALRTVKLEASDPDGDLAPLVFGLGPIEELKMSIPLAAMPAWLAIAATQPACVEVTTRYDRWNDLACRRAGTGAPWRLDFGDRWLVGESGDILVAMAELLDALPPGAAGAISIRPVQRAWTAARRRRVADALARHPAVDHAGLVAFKAPP